MRPIPTVRGLLVSDLLVIQLKQRRIPSIAFLVSFRCLLLHLFIIILIAEEILDRV